MTCREVVELISDYVEGALSAPVAASLRRHLDGCDGCTEYLAQMRATIRATAASGQNGDGPDREALRRAFRRFRADS